MAGIEFYMYPSAPPAGEWAYQLDEWGVTYKRGQSWPFRQATDRDLLAAMKRKHFPAPAAGCGVSAIRLSPDTEYRSWGNEYVSVSPSWTAPEIAETWLTLHVAPHGMGADVTRCKVTLDLTAGTFTVGECMPEVKEQAEVKAARLIAFFRAAQADAEAGKRKPVTAHERYEQGDYATVDEMAHRHDDERFGPQDAEPEWATPGL